MGLCAPVVTFSLKGSKPAPRGLPDQLLTLGDHLRKVRIERKLSQPQVARILGVDTETIFYWEKNRNSPTPKWSRKIIEFLGYFPFDWKDQELKTQVNYARMVSGHNLKQMGQEIGIDESTIYKILEGKSQPRPETLKNIYAYIIDYLS